jgi:hypothetical protein
MHPQQLLPRVVCGVELTSVCTMYRLGQAMRQVHIRRFNHNPLRHLPGAHDALKRVFAAGSVCTSMDQGHDFLPVRHEIGSPQVHLTGG